MPHGYIQIRSFHNKKSEHDLFSAYLKEQATETINCEKIMEEIEKIWRKQKFCHIWKEEFEEEFSEKH